MSKIIISEAEKNEILKMYINEVKIDDSSKTEISNYLKSKNKEFISELLAQYNKEVPTAIRVMIGSLDNLENNLIQYFNSQIPSFLSMVEAGKLPDESIANNFVNGIIQIFENEVNEIISGVGGWGKKQILKSAVKDAEIKDKETFIAELSKPSSQKQFSKYVRNVLSLISKWIDLDQYCKTSSSQMCKNIAPGGDWHLTYNKDYTMFFITLWAKVNRVIGPAMNRLTTKIASKVFD